MAPVPTILALARSIGGFYHGQLLAGLVRQVNASGGRVIVAGTIDESNGGESWMRVPRFRLPLAWDDVDAVVSIALGSSEDYLARARAEGKPVVLASHHVPGFDGPVVLPDNHGGARSAVEHLIAHGHTRIGFVGSMDQHDYRERREAYRTTMAEHGLPAGDDLFFPSTSWAKSGAVTAAKAFLAARERPTALVAATDDNALGLMEIITDAGLSVPHDLAIIGFDNLEEGMFTVPSLTSVSQRFDDVGALAGCLALTLATGKEIPAGIYTANASSLALRASCGCRCDLVDERPSPRTHAIPARRDLLRAEANRKLRTLLQERADTDVGTGVAKAIGLLDDMLTMADEPHNDAVRTLVHALVGLAGGSEMLQRVATVLNEYAQGAVNRASDGQSRAGATRAFATLWELEARGYLNRLRRLDSSAFELNVIADGLLRTGGARSRSLAWLADTHAGAAVLALWQGPVDEGRLLVTGIHDPDGKLDIAVGHQTDVRRFPPASLVAMADGTVGEMCLVTSITNAEQDHELGLLAMIGTIDPSSIREPYFHWTEMLYHALAGDELQAAVRTSEERYAAAARAANDGLWEWNATAGHVYLSQRCRDLLNVPADATPDTQVMTASIHPSDLEAARKVLSTTSTHSRKPVEAEFRVVHENGVARWVQCRALGVAPDADNQMQRLVGSVSDIDDRKTLEEQLRQAALFDPVTGLPNRRLFLDRLEAAMRRPRQHKAIQHAVLFIDLDEFKLINDTFGHLLGDELLRIVGERLRVGLRESDTAARFGGDEFAVLLTDPVQDDLLVVARRIQERITTPVMLGGQEVSVTASIGIAVFETGYSTAEAVLHDADIAMYQAKDSEPGTACLFDPVIHEHALDRLRTRSTLTSALNGRQFVTHYQPIVDMDGSDITRLEALVRWQHPERGLLCPAEFLPSMTANPTIVTLGHKVLDDVCRQIAIWRHQNHTVTVSVNLSHREFWDPGLVDTVRSALERHDVPPTCLTLETTEPVVMTDPDEARGIMAKLRTIGVRLHLDGFGTGSSSLHVLRTLPFDALKIDSSLVNELSVNTRTTALVRAIIATGTALGLATIAECVETSEQEQELRTMDCTAAQGWLYARAMPAADASALLGTRPRKPHGG